MTHPTPGVCSRRIQSIHYLPGVSMSHTTRLALGLAAAVAMMAGLAASASAGNFSTSNQTLRATWSAMTFAEPLGATIMCPVTLEASLHARTFVKGTYNLIGHITRPFVGTCSGGEASILSETLPWSIRYQSFEGRLPDIASTNLLVAGTGLRVHANSSGATCLFTSRETAQEHLAGRITREAGGALTSIEVGGEILSNEACGLGLRIRSRFSGRSTTLTVLNSSNRITLTLI
jgi:hypothetical protein